MLSATDQSKHISLNSILFLKTCFYLKSIWIELKVEFTLEIVWDLQKGIYPTDAYGATYIPTVQKPSGMDQFLFRFTKTNTPTNAWLSENKPLLCMWSEFWMKNVLNELSCDSNVSQNSLQFWRVSQLLESMYFWKANKERVKQILIQISCDMITDMSNDLQVYSKTFSGIEIARLIIFLVIIV